MDLMDIPPSRTIADVMTTVEAREARYRQLLVTALQGWTPSPRESDWLRAVLGHAPAGQRVRADASLMSNLELRRHVTRSLIAQMTAHFEAQPAWRRYFSITFVNEFGHTLDRAPQLHLDAFRRVVDKALRAAPLSAICVFELQAIMNYPARGRGRALLLHSHALAWTDDPTWRLHPDVHGNAWAERLNRSRAWTCELGADPVRIKLISATATDIATVAAYITKPPHNVKNHRRLLRRPGHYELRDEDELEPDLALRVAEGLSHITFAQAIFSVRATAEANAWRRAIAAWQQARLGPHTVEVGDRAAVAARWAELRRRFGSALYRAPYEFLSGQARPTSIHLS